MKNQMKYTELEVRTALIVHGYDEKNKEIAEEVNEKNFISYLFLLNSIQC